MSQPKPIPNENPELWAAVIEDMHARDRLGKERYFTPLQIENGRDFGQDLYEELLDATVYCKGLIEAHKKRVQSLLILIGRQEAELQQLRAKPTMMRSDATRAESVSSDVEPLDVPEGSTQGGIP